MSNKFKKGYGDGNCGQRFVFEKQETNQIQEKERCHLKPRVNTKWTASRQLDDDEDVKVIESMSEFEEIEIRKQAAHEDRRKHENQMLYNSDICDLARNQPVRCSRCAVGIFHFNCDALPNPISEDSLDNSSLQSIDFQSMRLG